MSMTETMMRTLVDDLFALLEAKVGGGLLVRAALEHVRGYVDDVVIGELLQKAKNKGIVLP